MDTRNQLLHLGKCRGDVVSSIRDLAREIVAREGGFTDNPNDPGGATKYGVTLKTLISLGLGNTVEALKKLTKDEAVNIFIKDYYDKPKIGLLPLPLRASVFDMYVNSGAHAVEILQKLLAEFDERATVDGAIGPNTAKATAAVYKKAGPYLVDAYAIGRRNYYFRLADRSPKLRVFARTRAGNKGGWIKRAEEFMDPKYRLTPAQFKARTAQWA